jgi:predicted O-methyltransferase YrrM
MSQDRWNQMSDWYENEGPERSTLQAVTTLCTMVDSKNRKRLLEIACASGIHSQIISKNFMSQDSLLVSCDFAQVMVQKMKQRYN